MKGEEPADKRRTLVTHTARQLVQLSLESEAGDYIGGEDELLERLSVSRPTLRQAAKVAEAEHMVSVRRGQRGGIYAARPDVDDALRSLNRYLRLRGTKLRDLSVLDNLSCEAASLAAGCSDAGLRADLIAMLDSMPGMDDMRSIQDLDSRFTKLIARMSGNPVIDLLIGMTYSFGKDERGIRLYETPEQRSGVRQLLGTIGNAIIAGDGELARFMMARRLAWIGQWLYPLGKDGPILSPEKFKTSEL